MINIKDISEDKIMDIKILNDGDESLHLASEDLEIDKIEEYRKTFYSMIYKTKQLGGIGLAAPQIGINKRFFIMQDMSNDEIWHICINPVIIEAEEIVQSREKCLSIKSNRIYTKERYMQITVKFIDENSKEVEAILYGNEAKIFQHELDHLNAELINTEIFYFCPKCRKITSNPKKYCSTKCYKERNIKTN